MRKKNLPKIYPVDNDMNREWFVSWRFETENKVSKLVKVRIPNLPTVDERLEKGKGIVADLLKNGYVPTEKHPHADSNNSIKLAFDWLESRKPSIRRKSHFTYQSHIRNLDIWAKANKLRTLDASHAASFLAYLVDEGRASGTINAHRRTLNACFNFAVRKGQMKKNPFVKTEKTAGSSDSLMPFLKQQASFVKSKMSVELWAAVRWLYYCFIRPGELRQIRIGDVDFDDGKILLRGAISKNKKSEWVIIPAPLMRELAPIALHQYDPTLYLVGADGLPSDTPVGFNFWSRRHRALMEFLKMNDTQYKLYSWKHTGVYQLAKKTKDYRAVQLQCRHHSLDQTMQYLRKIGIEEFNNIRDEFPEI